MLAAMRLSPVSAGRWPSCRRRMSPAQQRAHAGLLQKRADAGGQAGDDPILPGDGAGEVELRRPDREPDRGERAWSRSAMRGAGGVDQRLRGDAADIEARSAQPVGFDQNRVEAELAGADRGDIAAGAAADDQNLAAQLVHALPHVDLAVIASACEAIRGSYGALRTLRSLRSWKLAMTRACAFTHPR